MKRLLASILFFTSFGVASAETICTMRNGQRFCVETVPDTGITLSNCGSAAAVIYYPVMGDSSGTCLIGGGTANHRYIQFTSRANCQMLCDMGTMRTSATVASGASASVASPSPFRRLLSTLGITRTAAPTPSFRASSSSGNAANSASAPASSYAAAPASPAAAVTPVTPASYVEGMIAAQPIAASAPAATAPSDEQIRTMMAELKSKLTCGDVDKKAGRLYELLLQRGYSPSRASQFVDQEFSGVCGTIPWWEEQGPTGRWQVWKCEWTPSQSASRSTCERKRLR